jgi:isopentenyl diphosphate isomerase/L-lactate dehydrogenase-like FMN-dependent dehydrogenase
MPVQGGLQDRDLARRRFLAFLAASPLIATPAGAQDPAPLITSPAQALNVFELQAVAAKNIPPAHYGYLMTGVLDDRTIGANIAAYSHWGLVPRRLAGIEKPDLSVKLFGQTWASPVLLAPLGSQRAFHPDGELGTARAAKARGALQVLSTVASTGIGPVIAARGGPVWFQIYPTDDFEVTKALVRKADAAGAGGIVLTLDLLDGGGRRETMQRLARQDTRQCETCHGNNPMRSASSYLRRPAFEGIDTSKVRDLQHSYGWDYVSRLRAVTKLPLLAKGIMSAEDAKLALKAGCDGIIVSNHGGRAEESLVGTLDVLPEVIAAVGGKAPVIVDGGVRRGTDVFKALALGAAMVGIGRPYIWGLGAFGQAGVETAMRLIDEELSQAMRQCGVARVADLKRGSLRRAV